MRRMRDPMGVALAALLTVAACGDGVVDPGFGGSGLTYVVSSAPYRLAILETDLQREVGQIQLNPVPQAVAITPDGSFVYVSIRSGINTNTVDVIDTETNRIETSLDVGLGAWTVTTSPDGGFVYVGNLTDSTVSVIETSLFRSVSGLFRRGQNEVVATVKLASGPVGISFTPAGDYAYVSSQRANLISVIETTNHTVVAEIPVGVLPQLLAITPDGAKVYVAIFGSDDISIINTASRTVVGSIDISSNGDGPFGVVVTPDGSTVYVTNFISGNVTVIDTATDTIATTIEIGRVGTGIAMAPLGDFLYVTGFDEGVTVIETATNTVQQIITVSGVTNGIAVGPSPSQ
jgi:YVTN family beta-propeller protein